MAWMKPIVLTLALGIATPMFVASTFAEDKPAEVKPTEVKPAEIKPTEEMPVKQEEKKEVKGPKLWSIWAKLTSLTPEQKIKIKEIHGKTIAEKQKLDQQEEADINAVLTDVQKLELQSLREEELAQKKAKAAEKAAGKKEKTE